MMTRFRDLKIYQPPTSITIIQFEDRKTEDELPQAGLPQGGRTDGP
jgi:hypothetical protein